MTAPREVLLTLTREYLCEPDADDHTARRLIQQTGRLMDAMRFARGPRGEVLMIGDDLLMGLAFHLARAGADQFDELAIIKPRAIPDRPGQIAGLVDWVPLDAPDLPDAPPLVSAQGPVPDVEDLDAQIPWHTAVKFEGDFQ